MPKLQAARVTQCGLDFAVVLVDPKLFMNPSELEAFSERAQALFPGVPVAMLSYDDLKVTRYHGPDDVVAFLKQVRVVSLPWVEYTIGDRSDSVPFRYGASRRSGAETTISRMLRTPLPILLKTLAKMPVALKLRCGASRLP